MTLFGDAGNDRLFGNDGTDFLVGGATDDKLYGAAGKDTLLGNDGTDYLNGGAADDKLYGMGGNDNVHGSAGNDYLAGGPADDKLYGASGKDALYGNDGNDYLNGGNWGINQDTCNGGNPPGPPSGAPPPGDIAHLCEISLNIPDQLRRLWLAMLVSLAAIGWGATRAHEPRARRNGLQTNEEFLHWEIGSPSEILNARPFLSRCWDALNEKKRRLPASRTLANEVLRSENECVSRS